MRVFTAKRLYTPLDEIENGWIVVEDGYIVHVASQREKEIPRAASVTDFGDAILAPGFIDLHIHGGGGHDVMEEDANALPAVERLLAKHGTTSYFPTTVTAPLDTTLRALERLADAIESSETSANDGTVRAKPLGLHLEGPFISHRRRGVHPESYLLPPKLETFERLWQASGGQVKMMTLAPELEGASELIGEAAGRGVCISMGHSDANSAAVLAGKRAGARHVTHTFNAMRPLDHRDPGILGEALTDGDLSADIIVDGIHVAPSIVELFVKAKGADNCVLITDAIAATGMPDGRYRLGTLEVEVSAGKCVSSGKLAGSVLTMDRAVRNIRQFAGLKLKDAVRFATSNAARVAKLEKRGRLEPGAAADFVILSKEGEVRATVIGGAVAKPAAQS